MPTSKLGNGQTVHLDDISKSRPFSLEERSLNQNDISFSRIQRTYIDASFYTPRVTGRHQPSSFYDKDVKKWQDKLKNLIKLQKIF